MIRLAVVSTDGTRSPAGDELSALWCATVPLLIYSPPIARRSHTYCNSCSRSSPCFVYDGTVWSKPENEVVFGSAEVKP